MTPAAAAPPRPPGAELLAGATREHALPDGRALAYVDCGAAGAPHVVLFLHPVQGNRLMALALHAPASRLGLRVLAPDRPGYGGSSPHAGRSVKSYIADLAHFLGALKVPKVGVLASSAGTMYAMALASDPSTSNLVAGRVTMLPPWLPPGSLPAGKKPSFTLRMMSLLSYALPAVVGVTNSLVAWKLSGRGATVADVMTRSKPHEVEEFKADPANDTYYRAMIGEWSRPGAAAAIAEEMLLCAEAGPARALGFSYQSPAAPPARVYAGAADALVPLANLTAWAEAAGPGRVELVVVDGGTHDGVVHTHKGAALAALAADLGAGKAPPRGRGG